MSNEKLEGDENVKVQLIRTSYDRKTGEKICSCVIKEMEVNEDAYYKPVVEVLYQNLKSKGLFTEKDKTADAERSDS